MPTPVQISPAQTLKLDLLYYVELSYTAVYGQGEKVVNNLLAYKDRFNEEYKNKFRIKSIERKYPAIVLIKGQSIDGTSIENLHFDLNWTQWFGANTDFQRAYHCGERVQVIEGISVQSQETLQKTAKIIGIAVIFVVGIWIYNTLRKEKVF